MLSINKLELSAINLHFEVAITECPKTEDINIWEGKGLTMRLPFVMYGCPLFIRRLFSLCLLLPMPIHITGVLLRMGSLHTFFLAMLNTSSDSIWKRKK